MPQQPELINKRPKRLSRTSKIKDLCLVFSYILLIYLTLPVMPGLWSRLSGYLGSWADNVAAFILSFLAAAITIYLLFKRKSSSSFIWLAVLALIYAFALSRIRLAIEKIHFIEYSLLSIFVFRALRHYLKGRSVYPWSAFAVFFVGLVDELIQKALPNRVGDARDIIVNAVSGVMGLLLIGLCFQPPLEKPDDYVRQE